ncbi:O-antigen ligase family protein, partial [Salipaludibacillus sp. CUR1]|uniref:O-antigen ligase family protein n=1 Tax=Salipaludibacillus sp. CUR1 TaxID=2820003 RepID=UPI001E54EC6D
IYLIFITFFKKEYNLFIILSIIFIIWRSFSSYYFSEGVLDLVNSFRILTLILLINITIKKYPKSTLKALSALFGFYIILNFISYLIFSGGLYWTGSQNAWILGIENQFGYFLIPGILLSILFSWYKHKKISGLSLFVVMLAVSTLLMAWSATAIVAVFFLLTSIFINVRQRIKPVYSFITLSILYLAIWFVIVRFNSFNSLEIIITDILGKDLTFSGRTRIWDSVFDTIPNSLWYGFGINSEVLGGIVTYFAAHNMILQIFLDTGLIGLTLFFICIVVGGVKLQKTKNNRVSVILLIGIFGILIGGITESYRMNYLFLLLTLSYNVKYLKK